MLDQRNAKSLILRTLQRLKKNMTDRRAAINELSFTYARLRRLLPTLVKRMSNEPLGLVLAQQQKQADEISSALTRAANGYGIPAEPCVCEEAHRVVENIYHEERAATTREGKSYAVLNTLMTARTFLIRTWGRLIDTLSGEANVAFSDMAHTLQRREADLFRELVVVGQQADAGSEMVQANHGARKGKRIPSQKHGRLRLAPMKGRSSQRGR